MHYAHHKLKMLEIVQNTNERRTPNKANQQKKKATTKKKTLKIHSPFAKYIVYIKCNAINAYVDLSMLSFVLTCMYLPCVVFVRSFRLSKLVDCGRGLTYKMNISGIYRSGFVSFLILMAIYLSFSVSQMAIFIWKSGLNWMPFQI